MPTRWTGNSCVHEINCEPCEGETRIPLAGEICGAEEKSAPGGTRTPNLLIRSQKLYPLSYGRQLRKDTGLRS